MRNIELNNEQTEEQVELTEDQKKFEQQKNELLEMSGEYSNNSREIFGYGVFNIEGGQELIDLFGTDRVLDAMEEVKKEGEGSLYNVICQLEPNRENRAKLYETILKSAEEKKEAYQNDLQTGSIPHGSQEYWIMRTWGPTDNNVRHLEFNLKEYAIFDGFFLNNSEGTTKAMSLMERFSRRLGSLGRKPFINYVDASMNDFGFTDLDKKRKELAENGDILLSAVDTKTTANKQLEQEISDKKQGLLQELSLTIEANIQTLNEKYLEAANTIIRDMDQTIGIQLEMQSSTSQEIGDRFIAELSAKLHELEEQAAREIEEANKPYNEIVESIT